MNDLEYQLLQLSEKVRQHSAELEQLVETLRLIASAAHNYEPIKEFDWAALQKLRKES